MPHSAVVVGRSRPRRTYAYVLGLIVAGLATAPAAAATPPTGGAQAGPAPRLRALACRTACAGVSVARAGLARADPRAGDEGRRLRRLRGLPRRRRRRLRPRAAPAQEVGGRARAPHRRQRPGRARLRRRRRVRPLPAPLTIDPSAPAAAPATPSGSTSRSRATASSTAPSGWPRSPTSCMARSPPTSRSS